MLVVSLRDASFAHGFISGDGTGMFRCRIVKKVWRVVIDDFF